MEALLTESPIAQNQIAEWKEKHPRGVFEFPYDLGDGTIIKGYFRKPTLAELDSVTAGIDKGPLKAARILYNTCMLGGHPAFKNDEDVIIASLKSFQEVTKSQHVEVKKL